MTSFTGYLRSDGRKGIRNIATVVYTVECAHHVAVKVAEGFDEAHVIGFGGCYPNGYAAMMLERLTTHPNVGAVLILSLGCEGFDRDALERAIAKTGRPVTTMVIQQTGGTRSTIDAGRAWLTSAITEMNKVERVPMELSDLVVGTICGGSDSTSGITANPAVGLAFDRLVAEGAVAIFEETGELIGMETAM